MNKLTTKQANELIKTNVDAGFITPEQAEALHVEIKAQYYGKRPNDRSRYNVLINRRGLKEIV